MTENKPEKPENNDIENCRQDILKAGERSAHNPETPENQNAPEDRNTPDRGRPRQKIPSFEDIIADDNSSSDPEINIDSDLSDIDNLDDDIDVKEISHILSETGPVDIDNVFEDEPKFDLIDDSDDSAEVLDDTDWQMLNEPSSNLDDVPMNGDDDNSLEMMVNIDDEEPLISRQEQDMLMEEHDIPDNEPNDEETNDDRIIIERMQDKLASLSEQSLPPQPSLRSESPNEPAGSIPKFDVYEKILSEERKQTASTRQAPQRKSQSAEHSASGTVGDIIRQTREDVSGSEQVFKNQAERIEPSEHAAAYKYGPRSSGIIHLHESLNDKQREIIEDIVRRDIEALCA